jgi:hypothetical protein
VQTIRFVAALHARTGTFAVLLATMLVASFGAAAPGLETQSPPASDPVTQSNQPEVSSQPPAADAGQQNWAVSAQLGAVIPGEVHVEPFNLDLDTETGFAALGQVDLWLTDWLSLGVQGLAVYTTVVVPDGLAALLEDTTGDASVDDDANVINLGATVKGHVDWSHARVSPGLALAYQITFAKTYDETVKGFSPGAFVEFSLPVVDHLRGVAEVGFISQPWGENADFDVTFGPIFYVTAGAQYGL